MSDYIFCIPSYKRADNQACLHYLHDLGFDRSMIYISTQDKNDYVQYKVLYGGMAKIAYRKGSCISDNRNTLLDMFGADSRIIMLADAIKSFHVLRGETLCKLETRKDVEAMIERGYDVCCREGAVMWGIYPIKNDFFMDSTYVVNNLIIGCFMAFEKNPHYRFAREYRLKEDFELSLRMIQDGKRIVRFNDVTIDRRHKIKGGCEAMWKSKGDRVNADACARIISKYPKLVTEHSTRQHEMRYIGVKTVIKLEGGLEL